MNIFKEVKMESVKRRKLWVGIKWKVVSQKSNEDTTTFTVVDET
jgi:hypothetical protein